MKKEMRETKAGVLPQSDQGRPNFLEPHKRIWEQTMLKSTLNLLRVLALASSVASSAFAPSRPQPNHRPNAGRASPCRRVSAKTHPRTPSPPRPAP